MRKIFAVAGLIIAVMTWYSCSVNFYPIRISDQKQVDTPLLYPPFKRGQLVVMYKNPPTPMQVTSIRQGLATSGIDTNRLRVRKCSNCTGDIELWEADNIHSIVHTEGVAGGTGSRTRGVGEDSIAWYSLNYINSVPIDSLGSANVDLNPPGKVTPVSGSKKDTIVVAVLDTGIDTVQWVHNANLWINKKERANQGDDDGNCFGDDINGWNFVSNNNNLQEDHHMLHGSLVSQYIINEFAASRANFLQVMVLKTHDNNGNGDLFSSICAIHYAMNNGAQIINASWGFYYYYDIPPPYLTNLITNKLAGKGILFVAAAGNSIPEIDIEARQIYRERYGRDIPDEYLRNLAYHSFYPACFSTATNNVLTVTTTDGTTVSRTQNYSSRFVDLGVKADIIAGNFMKFKLPFVGTSAGQVSGSSFAAAIASGKAGAWLSKTNYRVDISKTNLMAELIAIGTTPSGPVIINISTPLLNTGSIREGRFINH